MGNTKRPSVLGTQQSPTGPTAWEKFQINNQQGLENYGINTKVTPLPDTQSPTGSAQGSLKFGNSSNPYGFTPTKAGLQMKFDPKTNAWTSGYSKGATWFQRNEEGLKTGMQAVGLGFSIYQGLDAMKTSRAQRDYLGVQKTALQEQTKEATAEYNRVKNLRKKITASY